MATSTNECTAIETSRTTHARLARPELQIERGWVLLKIHGPFALDAIGILASVTKPLAEAAVSVFALSTFDTDYILVKRIHAKQAIAALTLAGHKLVETGSGAFRRS